MWTTFYLVHPFRATAIVVEFHPFNDYVECDACFHVVFLLLIKINSFFCTSAFLVRSTVSNAEGRRVRIVSIHKRPGKSRD